MIGVISGLAISHQWAPTLEQAEYLLTGEYEARPSLVEHPGEVITKALEGIPDRGSARLTMIQLGSQADLGHYQPAFQAQWKSIVSTASSDSALLPLLQGASEYIQERHHHLVIFQTSPEGTAAVAFSHHESRGPALVAVKNPELVRQAGGRFDYAGAAFQGETAMLKQLDSQIRRFSPGKPIPLGSFNAPRGSEVSLLALIQTSLAILNQVIPGGIKDQNGTQANLPTEHIRLDQNFRPWLSWGADSRRTALFAELNRSGSGWDFIALEEIPRDDPALGLRIIPGLDPNLFLLRGDRLEDFQAAIAGLEKDLSTAATITALAQESYAKFTGSPGRFTCCLLGVSREQLLHELSHARNGIEESFQSGRDWISPAGSSFTSRPLQGEIALVYPGGFNSYRGMAGELLFSFPGLQDAVRDIIPDLSHSLAEEILLDIPGQDGQDRGQPDEEGIYSHPNQLIESGISLAVLHTLLLESLFDLRADAALGYSLGEISMLWANRVWQDAEDGSLRWSQSRLLQDQLVGEMRVVRSHWQDELLAPDFWATYILKAQPDRVQAACDQEPLVFLTIQNTAEECVIAGEKSACERVIKELGSRALLVPFSPAIHNPAMAAAYPEFAELYSNPTFPRAGIRFYSAADYQALELSRQNLARSMAKMTCQPIDFPRLIEQAYQDGVRIFIEVGPQKTCSRWIEKILSGKPHLAAPANKKFQRDLPGIMKVISLLVSHGVNLNLERIFASQNRPLQETSSGGPPRISERRPGERKTHLSGRMPEHTSSPIPARSGGTDYFEHLERISAGAARSHQIYLDNQRTLTKNMVKVLELSSPGDRRPTDLKEIPAAKYSRWQIQEFTLGDPASCFGDLFSGFGTRRMPLLPNGPLQFIDRVLQVPETMGKLAPGETLTAAYDLSSQEWFREDVPHSLPYVSLLELALQPCGFLSAYLGSILGRENQDLYFRNLDGEGTLLGWPENPGTTLFNRVELISSSSLDQVVIQKYSYDVTWGRTPFFRGSSSFGYFSEPMLRSQAGLDGGEKTSPWQEDHPEAGAWKDFLLPFSSPPLDQPHLPRPQRIWIAKEGGRYGNGYLYLKYPILADAWFFKAHFHQDPVMPGSLGIELMARALMAAAPSLGEVGDRRWRIRPGTQLEWKYRGQITPQVSEITLDLHIKEIRQQGSRCQIRGDGQLWKDSLRIYQVNDLSLESIP